MQYSKQKKFEFVLCSYPEMSACDENCVQQDMQRFVWDLMHVDMKFCRWLTIKKSSVVITGMKNCIMKEANFCKDQSSSRE